MLVTAVGLALVATLVGTLAAPILHLPGGPLIITVAAGLFALGVVFRRVA
jgi:ABC-type Mn2+/Zn2+ transport system permease subunit